MNLFLRHPKFHITLEEICESRIPQKHFVQKQAKYLVLPVSFLTVLADRIYSLAKKQKQSLLEEKVLMAVTLKRGYQMA
ncbi:hypothetical protein COX95_00905 [bacterium CG_4_10_14_0_2_um_filter_33_32]|nr:MAG: hypothetical protein COZ97_00520 [bacterium CG_4_8_14_3_um_filter_33_28]PIY84976.1 MAG: hypothetical protein COY76_04515 [bacterium CG_4_10_14_0_8_um_filter_33_57]PIZ86536.1 MAG: hypothetical protein COX95_00905 [bacterium CG_4_10_14_0_2_um_filter_33_32]